MGIFYIQRIFLFLWDFFLYGNFFVFFYIGEFFLFLRALRPARCYWGIFSLRERGGEAPELFSFIFRGCKIYGHSISIHEIFLSFFQNARAIYAATKHIKICLLFPFYLLSSLKFYIFFLYYYFFYLLLYILNQCDNTVYKQNYIFTY